MDPLNFNESSSFLPFLLIPARACKDIVCCIAISHQDFPTWSPQFICPDTHCICSKQKNCHHHRQRRPPNLFLFKGGSSWLSFLPSHSPFWTTFRKHIFALCCFPQINRCADDALPPLNTDLNTINAPLTVTYIQLAKAVLPDPGTGARARPSHYIN